MHKKNLKKVVLLKFFFLVCADVPRPVKFVDLPSEISENNLTMRWSKPGDNGTQITHYTVYQRVLSEDGSAPEWTPLIWVPANQRLEFEVSGMETGKTYEFQVTATNKCGEGPEVQESIKRVKVSIGMGYINLACVKTEITQCDVMFVMFKFTTPCDVLNTVKTSKNTND